MPQLTENYFLPARAGLEIMALPPDFFADSILVCNSQHSHLAQLYEVYAGFEARFGKPKTNLEPKIKNFIGVRLLVIELINQQLNNHIPAKADVVPHINSNSIQNVILNINSGSNPNQEYKHSLINPNNICLKKAASGKPYLTHTDFQISLSHSQKYVAALISKNNCGIDIQVYDKKLNYVAKRVFSNSELAWASSQIDLLAALWVAKEAVYKWVGLAGLHFQRDILIEILDDKSSQQQDYMYIKANAQINFNNHTQNIFVDIVLKQDFALAVVDTK